LEPGTTDDGVLPGTSGRAPARTRAALVARCRLRFGHPGPSRPRSSATARRGVRLRSEALRVARDNATLNDMAGVVAFTRRDLRRLPPRPARRFDVVCANLLADLIQAHLVRLTRLVAPGGKLVLAGILATEFDTVCLACARAGLGVGDGPAGEGMAVGGLPARQSRTPSTPGRSRCKDASRAGAVGACGLTTDGRCRKGRRITKGVFFRLLSFLSATPLSAIPRDR